MNKEEIEQVEEIKKMLNFTTEGTSLRINNEVSKLLLKYIKKLEQKESILDKITDKLKEDIAISEKGKDTNIILIKEYYKNKQEYAQEILNSIEGDKQNGNV